MNGNDQTTIHLRAAANYINNGSFDEALNVLNSMEDRDARWYYYSAQANAGKGNQATAMEHARRAVELAPDNMQYRMFYQRMNSGGEWYTGRQQTYQNPARIAVVQEVMAMMVIIRITTRMAVMVTLVEISGDMDHLVLADIMEAEMPMVPLT